SSSSSFFFDPSSPSPTTSCSLGSVSGPTQTIATKKPAGQQSPEKKIKCQNTSYYKFLTRYNLSRALWLMRRRRRLRGWRGWIIRAS
ncbi:MAG: hypothetical protein ABGW82_02725, partial [Paracoccus sp. (in: a-proteobacteria)]